VVGAEGDDDAPERDEEQSGPRPDPLDRPWVHPSELRSFVANPTAAPQVRPREWAVGLTSAAVAVVATVLVLVAFGVLGERTRSTLPPPIPTNQDTITNYADAARVAQAVEPTIVTVATHTATGDPLQVASGVAVKSNRVLTSAHLLTGAASITIATNDRHTYTAKVMGSDPDTDLALLDVTDGDLAYPVLSDDQPAVGQPVVAVAVSKSNAPFVAINVLTDQNVLVDTSAGSTIAGLLRVGVTTSPESSGGGLFDTAGRLLGILVTPPTGFVPLVGLAVPVSVADDVRQQIESSGSVTHGWLGVQVADTDRSGAKVTALDASGPAAAAKLEVNDVITRAGDTPVVSAADLWAAFRRGKPGETLTLTYERHGTSHVADATLSKPSGSDPDVTSTSTPDSTSATTDTTAAPG
jgi:S1-C subfamily serine protease